MSATFIVIYSVFETLDVNECRRHWRLNYFMKSNRIYSLVRHQYWLIAGKNPRDLQKDSHTCNTGDGMGCSDSGPSSPRSGRPPLQWLQPSPGSRCRGIEATSGAHRCGGASGAAGDVSGGPMRGAPTSEPVLRCWPACYWSHRSGPLALDWRLLCRHKCWSESQQLRATDQLSIVCSNENKLIPKRINEPNSAQLKDALLHSNSSKNCS